MDGRERLVDQHRQMCCCPLPPSNSSVLLGIGPVCVDSLPVAVVNEFKFLGVTFDCWLSGDSYFRDLRRRLVCSIAALVRVRRLLPSDILVLIYHAFISSYLSYGIVAFGLNFSGKIAAVETLQKRAIRVATKSGPRAHCGPLFARLSILPYSSLIKFSVCLLISRILTNSAPNVIDLVPSRSSTRGGSCRLLLPPRHRVAVGGRVVPSFGTPSPVSSGEATTPPLFSKKCYSITSLVRISILK